MAYAKNFVNYYDVFKEEDDYVATVNKLVSLFERYNVKSILDVGCGTGKIDQLLSNENYEVTGIDYSKEMVDYAIKNYPDITFKQMDAKNFKFDYEFDAIIALDSVLSFLTKDDDFEKAIKNMVEHLSKGGLLFFDIGFTEKLIPEAFEDYVLKEVDKDGNKYKRESFMKRKDNLLHTKIKIFENDNIVIEEEHTHRVLSQDKILKVLSDLGCEVKSKGNSKENEYRPLEVRAKKL